MPPKKAQKRKRSETAIADDIDDELPLAPPNRETWPGWVEMESDPAFFNVMLKEMGARGLKVNEVYDLYRQLPTLPRPVHALIFLFQYKTQDEADQEAGSPQNHLWFANQVPSFACATVALLNIVNNISGLEMGPELREFKDFTKDMDSLTRGEAIDNFDFARRIHNSFARENELLNADMHLKYKIDRIKKQEAAAKGRATKAAKKAAKEVPLQEQSPNVTVKPERVSARTRKPPASAITTPDNKCTVREGSSSELSSLEDDAFKPTSKSKKGVAREVPKPNRRSARTPKPRNTEVYQSEAEVPEEGFHFIAYMPIDNHVWKLDGLDYHPCDMGSFGIGGNGADGGTGDWTHVVVPTLQNRMSELDSNDIRFELMAVTHDPLVDDQKELLENVKIIQAMDTKLDALFEDWRALDGGETRKDTLIGTSAEYGITQLDLDATKLSTQKEKDITAEDDFMKLIESRQRVIAGQATLRAAVREARSVERKNEEEVKHRRHDYSSFVKGWLGALAEHNMLASLLDA